MRLFDKVASMGRAEIRELLLDGKTISLNVDELVDHHYDTDIDVVVKPEEKFPFAISPWKSVFVEWDRPFCGQQGFHSYFMDANALSESGSKHAKAATQWVFDQGASAVNYIISFAWAGNQILENSWFIVQLLREDGTMIGAYAKEHKPGNSKPDCDQSRSMITAHNFVAAMAFSFANCSNVKLEDRTEEYQPPAKIMRRLKLPCVKRYTLNIDGHSTAHRSGSEPGQTGIMPFHLCRGHFATYTADRPRFGRASDGVGRFWVRPHVRGREERGRVEKDYAIS